jgi:hypothetical protein
MKGGFRYQGANKPNPLLEICVASREVMKRKSTAIGPYIPGLKGVIYINRHYDVIVLKCLNLAFATDAMIKGVENAVMDSE